EERAATWPQGVSDQRPEGLELTCRDMRQPESEKREIERSRRQPREDVSDQVLHVVCLNSSLVDRNGLGRRVECDNPSVAGCEMVGPQPGPTGELEYITVSYGVVERRFDDGHFGKPGRTMFRSAVVPAFAQEPFIVLRCPRAVVLDLLAEKHVVFHMPVDSTPTVTHHCRPSRWASYKSQPRRGVARIGYHPVRDEGGDASPGGRLHRPDAAERHSRSASIGTWRPHSRRRNGPRGPDDAVRSRALKIAAKSCKEVS